MLDDDLLGAEIHGALDRRRGREAVGEEMDCGRIGEQPDRAFDAETPRGRVEHAADRAPVDADRHRPAQGTDGPLPPATKSAAWGKRVYVRGHSGGCWNT